MALQSLIQFCRANTGGRQSHANLSEHEIKRTRRNIFPEAFTANLGLQLLNQNKIYSEHEACYAKFKKLVRNSEYSKSDNLKNFSTLAQVLSFIKKRCMAKMSFIKTESRFNDNINN